MICTDFSRPTGEYYLGRSVPGLRFASYPQEMAANPAIIDRSGYTEPRELQLLRDDAEELAAAVQELAPGRSAWLLWVDVPMNRPLLQALERRGLQAAPAAHYRLNQVGIPVRVLRVTRS